MCQAMTAAMSPDNPPMATSSPTHWGEQRMDTRKGNREQWTRDVDASRVLGVFLFFFSFFLLIKITVNLLLREPWQLGLHHHRQRAGGMAANGLEWGTWDTSVSSPRHIFLFSSFFGSYTLTFTLVFAWASAFALFYYFSITTSFYFPCSLLWFKYFSLLLDYFRWLSKGH